MSKMLKTGTISIIETRKNWCMRDIVEIPFKKI